MKAKRKCYCKDMKKMKGTVARMDTLRKARDVNIIQKNNDNMKTNTIQENIIAVINASLICQIGKKV